MNKVIRKFSRDPLVSRGGDAYICRMQATDSRIEATTAAPRRLDVALFDQLTSAKKAQTIDEKAALVGMHRSTLFRLRNGELDLALSRAMSMAETLGVSVEKLFPGEQPKARAA